MGPDSPKQQAAFSPRQLGVGQPKKEATLSNMPEKKRKKRKNKEKSMHLITLSNAVVRLVP